MEEEFSRSRLMGSGEPVLVPYMLSPHNEPKPIDHRNQANYFSDMVYLNDEWHCESHYNFEQFDERNTNATWRLKERMKTSGVALIVCLNIGIDPPDIIKPNPCAKLECWFDPTGTKQKGLEYIGNALQQQYEKWQSKAKYKQCLDPTSEELRRICINLRKGSRSDRLLLHYNGHGVPKPTENGELWVFGKYYTHYTPVAIVELRGWLGDPAIYVLDCSGAGILIPHIVDNAALKAGSTGGGMNDGRSNGSTPQAYNQAPSAGAGSTYFEHSHPLTLHASMSTQHFTMEGPTIVLAACKANEILPMDPNYPADLFTACLTTPITIAIRWFILHNPYSMLDADPDIAGTIPGKDTDRKTPRGELNWIFTAITDTIAWTTLPSKTFQKMFRQDLLVASLFRNYLLARRIMKSFNCTPQSWPLMPDTTTHYLWQSWDMTLEAFINNNLAIQRNSILVDPRNNLSVQYDNNNNRHLLHHQTELPKGLTAGGGEGGFPSIFAATAAANSQTMPSNLTFFTDQLIAFDVWLDFSLASSESPVQLPVVLQALLSQTHRLRALQLLKKYLALGPAAVNLSLMVGIYPYILKLLQSPAEDIKQTLVAIWASIIGFDASCRQELIREKAQAYFIQFFQSVSAPPAQRCMAMFVLAEICNKFKEGQQTCLHLGLHRVCTTALTEDKVLQSSSLKQWICLCLYKLCDDSPWAKYLCITEAGHTHLYTLLADPDPTIRVVAVLALGEMFGASSLSSSTSASGSIGSSSGGSGGPSSAVGNNRGTNGQKLDERDLREAELQLAWQLLDCCTDGSVSVRLETIYALSKCLLLPAHIECIKLVARCVRACTKARQETAAAAKGAGGKTGASSGAGARVSSSPSNSSHDADPFSKPNTTYYPWYLLPSDTTEIISKVEQHIALEAQAAAAAAAQQFSEQREAGVGLVPPFSPTSRTTASHHAPTHTHTDVPWLLQPQTPQSPLPPHLRPPNHVMSQPQSQKQPQHQNQQEQRTSVNVIPATVGGAVSSSKSIPFPYAVGGQESVRPAGAAASSQSTSSSDAPSSNHQHASNTQNYHNNNNNNNNNGSNASNVNNNNDNPPEIPSLYSLMASVYVRMWLALTEVQGKDPSSTVVDAVAVVRGKIFLAIAADEQNTKSIEIQLHASSDGASEPRDSSTTSSAQSVKSVVVSPSSSYAETPAGARTTSLVVDAAATGTSGSDRGGGYGGGGGGGGGGEEVGLRLEGGDRSILGDVSLRRSAGKSVKFGYSTSSSSQDERNVNSTNADHSAAAATGTSLAMLNLQTEPITNTTALVSALSSSSTAYGDTAAAAIPSAPSSRHNSIDVENLQELAFELESINFTSNTYDEAKRAFVRPDLGYSAHEDPLSTEGGNRAYRNAKVMEILSHQAHIGELFQEVSEEDRVEYYLADRKANVLAAAGSGDRAGAVADDLIQQQQARVTAVANLPPSVTKFEEKVLLTVQNAVLTSLVKFHAYQDILVVSDESSVSIWSLENSSRIMDIANKHSTQRSTGGGGHGHRSSFGRRDLIEKVRTIEHSSFSPLSEPRITAVEWINESYNSLLLLGSDDGVVKLWRDSSSSEFNEDFDDGEDNDEGLPPFSPTEADGQQQHSNAPYSPASANKRSSSFSNSSSRHTQSRVVSASSDSIHPGGGGGQGGRGRNCIELASAFAALPDIAETSRGSGLLVSWHQSTGTLIAGGNSNTVRVWDLGREQCVRFFETGSHTCLTALATTVSAVTGGGNSERRGEEGTAGPGGGRNVDPVELGGGEGGGPPVVGVGAYAILQDELARVHTAGSGGAGGGAGAGAAGIPPGYFAGSASTNFSPSWTFGGFADGSIAVFDERVQSNGGRVHQSREHSAWVASAHMRSNHLEVITSSVRGSIKFWDIRSLRTYKTLDVQKSALTSMSVHSCAPVLATGSHAQFIKILTFGGEQLGNIIKYHDGFLGQRMGPITSLTFHPHRMMLAASAADCIISIYATADDTRTHG